MTTSRGHKSVAEIEATIIYDPYRPGLRKSNRSNIIVAEFDFGFAEYYQHLIKKGTGKIIQGIAWKPHVTIFDGRSKLSDNAQKLWKKYHGKKIVVKYNVEVEKHWKFWVLPVVDCDFFKEIRAELGMKPDFPFHITVGRDFDE